MINLSGSEDYENASSAAYEILEGLLFIILKNYYLKLKNRL